MAGGAGGWGLKPREPWTVVEVLSSVVTALLLVLVAAWLMNSHARTWQRVWRRRKELEPNELDYRRRQFRRRVQTSAIVGLIGIGILAAQLISLLPVSRVLVVIVWGVVMLLAIWLGLLAVADMIATRHYFRRLKQSYLVQEACLQAELRRLQRTRGNGQAAEGREQKEKGKDK